MGLNEGSRTNRTFLNIIQGTIRKKADVDTPMAEKRYSEKKGQDVYELVYPSLTGYITGLKIAGTEFGDVLEIGVQDVDEKFMLNIPVESRYFSSFANKIKNIRFGNPLTISPYDFDDKTEINKKTGKPKKVTGINIYQKGSGWEKDKVPNYYTKATKDEGQPTLKENYSEKELKIFFLDQDEFYRNIVNEYSNKIVTPNDVTQEFAETTTHETAAPYGKGGGKETTEEPAFQDDLPFISPYNQRVPLLMRRRGFKF